SLSVSSLSTSHMLPYFFFTPPATTQTYTLSLHDALPISRPQKEMPMRTLEQTTDEILSLTATHFKVPRAELAPNDDFFKKLGIEDRKSTRLNSSHGSISYAVFCLKKKKNKKTKK